MASKIIQDFEIKNNLSKKLNEQRKNGKNCDYTLKTEDNGSFAVHKCVLEAISPFFEKMFNFDSVDKDKDSVLLKRCSSSNILEKIIEFIYTGEVEVTPEIARDVIDTSLFLGLNTIGEGCTEILADSVNEENCFELLEYCGIYFQSEPLKSKCVMLFAENIKMLVNKPEFVELSLDAMKILCLNNESVCTDEGLYLAVTEWITYDMKNREQFLSILLETLKFENISYEFAVKHFFGNNPFSNNQIFILKIADFLKKDWKEQVEKGKGRNPIASSRSASLYSIFNSNIFQYDNYNMFSAKVAKMTTNRVRFAYSVFGKQNIFIGGGFENLLVRTNRCEYYSFQENCWKSLPPMRIPRYTAQAVTLNDKIYVCGGWDEKTMEFFDINKNIWYDGPPKTDKIEWPGLCFLENHIYVWKKNIERFDPRENTWNTLGQYNLENEIFSTIGYDNKIYGITRNDIVTFDIRNNRIIDNVQKYEEAYSNLTNIPKSCLIGDKIYIMAKDRNDKMLLQTYKATDLSFLHCSASIFPNSCCALFFI